MTASNQPHNQPQPLPVSTPASPPPVIQHALPAYWRWTYLVLQGAFGLTLCYQLVMQLYLSISHPEVSSGQWLWGIMTLLIMAALALINTVLVEQYRQIQRLQQQLAIVQTRLVQLGSATQQPDGGTAQVISESASPLNPVAVPAAGSDTTPAISPVSDQSSLLQTTSSVAAASERVPEILQVAAQMNATHDVSQQSNLADAVPQQAAQRPALWATLHDWLTGGNSIVRVAVLVLLVGVILLLRFIGEQWQLSLAAKLAGVALGGALLTATGIALRRRRLGYAVSLQAAGLAIGYLVLFSAYYLHVLQQLGLTYGLLCVLLGLTLWLALWQSSLFLAFIALGSGFVAPFVLNQGQPDIAALMGFYFGLNLALAVLAWWRPWRILNVTALIMTLGIGGMAIWRFAEPDQYMLIALWVWGIFAVYLVMSVRYSQLWLKASQQDPLIAQRLPKLDTTLIFATPFMAFSLLAGVVQSQQRLSLASLLLAVIYAAVGWWMHRQSAQEAVIGHADKAGDESPLPLLSQSFYGLALVFAALVLPFAFGAYWSSVGWAVNAVALVYLSDPLKLNRARIMGVVLLWAATAATLYARWVNDEPILFACSILMLSHALVGIHLLRARRGSLVVPVGWHPMAVVLVLLSYGLSVYVFTELARRIGLRHWIDAPTAVLLWHVLINGALHIRPTNPNDGFTHAGYLPIFNTLRWAIQGSTAIWIIWWWFKRIGDGMEVMNRWESLHAALGLGAVLWLVSFILQTKMMLSAPSRHPNLHWLYQADLARGPIASYILAPVAWVMLGMVSVIWLAPQLQLALWPLIPAMLMLMSHYGPVTWRKPHYLAGWQGHWGVVGVLALWLLWCSLTQTGAEVLQYRPLLNTADLLSLLVMVVLVIALRPRLGDNRVSQRNAAAALLLIAGLLLISSMLMRLLSRWQDVGYWSVAAWHNGTIQTALTILWASTALIATLLASRRQWRMLWMLGISILVLVIAKLVLFDLSQTGTLTRIISFIGSGLIMLVIGYFAPLPPARPDMTEPRESSAAPSDSSEDSA